MTATKKAGRKRRASDTPPRVREAISKSRIRRLRPENTVKRERAMKLILQASKLLDDAGYPKTADMLRQVVRSFLT